LPAVKSRLSSHAQLCDSLNQIEQTRKTLEKDHKRLRTERVRYIELASNVGPLSQVQSRNVAALQEALVSERERANAAASALRLLDEELHNTSQELRYEDRRSLFLYIRSCFLYIRSL
jgi:hypothetical protein